MCESEKCYCMFLATFFFSFFALFYFGESQFMKPYSCENSSLENTLRHIPGV